ncbi:FRG domain-containing protein [Vibrio parahaemolyticus]|uniref:FRG domain-containing protein n=1 Tax=Vibrio parahaemolyticus TaxID=670 RepID=UPI00111CE898|nr:FRG domain-containing protein [Vibrio parahaemolyticus]TOD35153.1 FRG domain-containing protein [Vibrio parahaemolyticus]
MKEIEINSVYEFIRYIENNPGLNNFWYRGVASDEFQTVPGLVWRNARKVESPLEHEFLVNYRCYSQYENLSPWETYALMQHHGLPTRLLDWTNSALIALFFALYSEPDLDTDRVVWVMNPFALNEVTNGSATLHCPSIVADPALLQTAEGKQDINSYLPPNLRPRMETGLPEKPLAVATTQHITRVNTQKGCFTVHGSADEPISTYIDNEDDFYMLRIKASSKKTRQRMLDVLGELGIDEVFVFQDLDHLCRNIERTWVHEGNL